MHFDEPIKNLLPLIAEAADLCLKPWKHAVIDQSLVEDDIGLSDSRDLIFRIECRCAEGKRHAENDLELEIFRSGDDLNLTLSWFERSDLPILWQGQHCVWMDGESGIRCNKPDGGAAYEALARRLRALISMNTDS